MSYAAVAEPLRAANLLAGRTLYSVRDIPVEHREAVSSGGARIPGGGAVGRDMDFDMVLVVAGGDPARFFDARAFGWLRRLAQRGVTLGGISAGPAILAAAGLMGGRRMTVHWEHAPALAERFPDLLIERSLYVIDRDRVTCAGGTAPLDLIHALIALRRGPAFARLVSDWFIHTEARPATGPQRAGLVARYGVTNRAILDAIEAMETHISDPLTLDDLAAFAQVSPRQINRLFREKMGAPTMAFYRNLRLEKARGLLTTSSLSITEIALATGFANSSHFSRAHTDRYGAPPRSVREQEGRQR